MKRVISNCQLVLIFTYITFIAITSAELPEEVKNEFVALRQRRLEARILENTNGNLRSQRLRGVDKIGSVQFGKVTVASNWAGAAQVSPPSGTFNYVSARWTIPTASRPTSANGSGEWYSSQWVGIDGYNCDSAMLQAGIDIFVNVSSTGSVAGAGAWYEWIPEFAIAYSNFSVAPGDTVEVSVTATSSSSGIVLINNLSTGKSTNSTLDAPDNSSVLCGTNAEWIVEDYIIQGVPVPFSNFTNVYFENCTATTTTGTTVNLSGAMVIDMEPFHGLDNWATASVINSAKLEVYYGPRSSKANPRIMLDMLVFFILITVSLLPSCTVVAI